jgi:hypothetical protein
VDIDKIIDTQVNVVRPIDFVVTKVDFGLGIVQGFASSYVNAINNKLVLRGTNFSFDEEELNNYLNFILQNRIRQVNGKRVDYAVKSSLNIPALYALTIQQIGKVYDKDLGIELLPHLDEDISSMTLDEALAFSKKLQLIEDLNFELVQGIPKDTDGSTEFMFFHVSDNMVTRHASDAHSGYAVLASFFRMKQLESVLTFRVNYGLVEEYDRMLDSLISKG